MEVEVEVVAAGVHNNNTSSGGGFCDPGDAEFAGERMGIWICCWFTWWAGVFFWGGLSRNRGCNEPTQPTLLSNVIYICIYLFLTCAAAAAAA